MSRKQKWKGIPLNRTNIDEYMDDLYDDTKGQYITQGVSFNKDDNFQMNLLKNALLAHGSFSGFVKHLMFSYFEDNDRLDDSIWIPNSTNNKQQQQVQQKQDKPPASLSPTPPLNKGNEGNHTQQQVQQRPAQTLPHNNQQAPKGGRRTINPAFLDPLEDE